MSRLRLKIQKNESDIGPVTVPRYEFSLQADSGTVQANSSLSPGSWKECEESMSDLNHKLNDLVGCSKNLQPMWDRLIDSISEVCPIPIKDHLLQADAYLELVTSQSVLPWEFCSSFSHLKFVTRVSEQPVRVLGDVAGAERATAVLAHGAHELADWAGPEVAAVRKSLGQCFEVQECKGKELTKRRFTECLIKGEHALIHLIGYVTREGLVFSDGVLEHSTIKRLTGNTRPRLVVVHCVMDRQSDFLVNSDAVARSLMESGVPAVLVTGWNIKPEGAAEAAGLLYASGGPLWQNARRCQLLDGTQSRSPYLAYGDWDLQLSELRPVHIETVQNAPTSRGGWQADFQLVVLEGPEKGSELPLFAAALDGGREITIGRAGARPVDLSFEDTSLDNVTASLKKIDQQLVLSNQTGVPEKVKVNGLPAYSTVNLNRGDEVAFGLTVLRIESGTTEGDQSPSQMPEEGRFCLSVVKGVEQDQGASFDLPARVSLVGRLQDCNLMLHDPSVSRHHLTLIPKEGAYFVSAIGDAPIVVNGFGVKEEHRLKHGDSLQLSPTTLLRFSDTSRPE